MTYTPVTIGNILSSCSDMVFSSAYRAEKDLTYDILRNVADLCLVAVKYKAAASNQERIRDVGSR